MALLALDDPKLWQLKFKDGGGERIVGESAESVKAARLKYWGDREIISVEEVK